MKSFLFFLILFQGSLSAHEKFARPTREVSIIVTKEGYYPQSFSVHEGEKVKFYVTSTIEEPHCMIVESHKVFLAANKGKVTEGEVVFDKAGDFSFYCPGSKSNGRIVVIKKQVKREIASEEPKVWMPK